MRGLLAVDLKEFSRRPRLPNGGQQGVDPLGGADPLGGVDPLGGDLHLGVIGGNPVAPVAGVERRQRQTLRGSCPWPLAFRVRLHGQIRGHSIFQVLGLAKPE